MRTFALDITNDIYLDASGNIAMLYDLPAVIQNCKTAMQSQLGEMQYDTGRGIPYRATMFDSYNPAQFTAAARQTLLAVEGVTLVESFNVDRVGDSVQYTAVIKTIFGTDTLNG